VQARRPAPEGRRDSLDGLARVGAEHAQVVDGDDGERQVPGLDRAPDGQPQAIDGGPRAAHLVEEARGDDEGGRVERGALEDGGAPAEGGLGLVGQEKSQRVVERRCVRAKAGHGQRPVARGRMDGHHRIPSGPAGGSHSEAGIGRKRLPVQRAVR
jgi:hypothetical protein